MSTLHALIHGLSSGATLIIAIGAQNAFVLRQGLRREHVLGVVLICALSDAVLIQAGVWGLGAAATALPALAAAARWLGAAFLLLYAIKAASRACRPGTLEASATGDAPSARTAFLTAVAMTWLNPHVYLDTVLLLGAIASPYGDTSRMAFAAGATMASLLWFTGLGYGARWLAPVFATPTAWRVLDGCVAATMVALAAGLLLPAHA